MKKHHYVYYSYEEWGRGYIGCRTCNCLPEEDIKYFGSFRDKTFKPTGKTILFVCETRKEAAEIEIELHNFFDVAVNPQFANKAKATSTKFDTAGVPRTEAQKKAMSGENHPLFGMTGEKHPMFGFSHTEESKKKMSEAHTGKTLTEETKKRMSEAHTGATFTEEHKKKLSVLNAGENNSQYGRTGALNPNSKAIIVIKPDGTKLHYGSCIEAARELERTSSKLSQYLNTDHVLTRGPFKGWQFLFKKFGKLAGDNTPPTWIVSQQF